MTGKNAEDESDESGDEILLGELSPNFPGSSGQKQPWEEVMPSIRSSKEPKRITSNMVVFHSFMCSNKYSCIHDFMNVNTR